MEILDISGKTIRDLRDALGWTREFLAEKSGVPYRTINDVETGTSKNPGIETIKALLRALPNYQPNQITKAQLITDLVTLLPSLNEDELGDLLTLASGFIGPAVNNSNVKAR